MTRRAPYGLGLTHGFLLGLLVALLIFLACVSVDRIRDYDNENHRADTSEYVPPVWLQDWPTNRVMP